MVCKTAFSPNYPKKSLDNGSKQIARQLQSVMFYNVACDEVLTPPPPTKLTSPPKRQPPVLKLLNSPLPSPQTCYSPFDWKQTRWEVNAQTSYPA